MKISAIDKNQITFGSRVRIQKNLSEIVLPDKHTSNLLLKRAKKLENNGIDDFVILSGTTKIDKYGSKEDVIQVQVVEKREKGYYVTSIPIEDKINVSDSRGKLHTYYDLDEMYEQAKEHMTKLKHKYNDFIQYW